MSNSLENNKRKKTKLKLLSNKIKLRCFKKKSKQDFICYKITKHARYWEEVNNVNTKDIQTHNINFKDTQTHNIDIKKLLYLNFYF